MLKTIFTFAFCAASFFSAATAEAQGRTLARLFWQDDSDASLRWGDLKKDANGFHLVANSVNDYPELDADEQSLVQMAHHDGLILVGVHDKADGTFGSGWVAIESGVTEEPHGDHSHWKFGSPPQVIQAVIDTKQGNPAHVYQYGDSFVLANDKKNGFTITSAQSIRQNQSAEQAATFVDGGNGHITLATVDDRVAYATWIAPAGEHVGRVDVVGLGPNAGKRYAVNCPTGGLHGATTNSGKVFLAPMDGVCWVNADVEMDDEPDSVQVNHLSLGSDAEGKPLRTGAFTNHGTHVLFTSGKQGDSKLCVINAADVKPCITDISLEIGEGQAVMSPVTMTTATGQTLACLFVESKEAPETDAMIVVDLDPNRDGVFTDARVKTTVDVGRNQMSAHAGHHDVVALPGGRRLAITNPGDQSIWILSLLDFSVQSKIELGGTPTRLLSVGG